MSLMLLATINCSIGNKDNHLTAQTVKELLDGREPVNNLERYAIEIIRTEATQQEIDYFIKHYNVLIDS